MATLGVILVHGLSSSLASVDGLVPHLVSADIPYRMPVLAGHGSQPEALAGIRWPIWVADADAAVTDLRNEVDAVAVVGLSMGGLAALTLATERRDLVGVVTLAAALRLKDRRVRFSPYLTRFVKRVSIPGAAPDEGYTSTTYPWIPSGALVELYHFGQAVERRLPEVSTPLLVIGTENDSIVRPESARVIYDRAGSHQKELRMFARSGHEMLQSSEKDAVMSAVMEFLLTTKKRLVETQAPTLGD
jgi:carboxylesterase